MSIGLAVFIVYATLSVMFLFFLWRDMRMNKKSVEKAVDENVVILQMMRERNDIASDMLLRLEKINNSLIDIDETIRKRPA